MIERVAFLRDALASNSQELWWSARRGLFLLIWLILVMKCSLLEGDRAGWVFTYWLFCPLMQEEMWIPTPKLIQSLVHFTPFDVVSISLITIMLILPHYFKHRCQRCKVGSKNHGYPSVLRCSYTVSTLLKYMQCKCSTAA
jgi:hypothetical protein